MDASKITIHRFLGSRMEIALVVDKLLSEHVFSRLDARMQSFMGMYDLIEGMKNETCFVYGVFEGTEYRGIGWGDWHGERLEIHSAFDRHFRKVRAAIGMIEKKMADDSGIRRLVAYVPDAAAHVAMALTKLGYTKITWPDPEHNFITADGETLPVFAYTKEL